VFTLYTYAGENMSRGLGRIQNGVMLTIQCHGKPMTFADIRAYVRRDLGAQPNEKLRASFERSLRRAIQRLVRDWHLIAIGDGGPRDPCRYFLHPMLIGMLDDTPKGRSLLKALEAAILQKQELKIEN
jgi:hypothetical protein